MRKLFVSLLLLGLGALCIMATSCASVPQHAPDPSGGARISLGNPENVANVARRHHDVYRFYPGTAIGVVLLDRPSERTKEFFRFKGWPQPDWEYQFANYQGDAYLVVRWKLKLGESVQRVTWSSPTLGSGIMMMGNDSKGWESQFINRHDGGDHLITFTTMPIGAYTKEATRARPIEVTVFLKMSER